jgi:hypothetical protein
LGDSSTLLKILLIPCKEADDSDPTLVHRRAIDCMILYRKTAHTRVQLWLDDDDVLAVISNNSSVAPDEFPSRVTELIWYNTTQQHIHEFMFATDSDKLLYLIIADFAECRVYVAGNDVS